MAIKYDWRVAQRLFTISCFQVHMDRSVSANLSLGKYIMESIYINFTPIVDPVIRNHIKCDWFWSWILSAGSGRNRCKFFFLACGECDDD